VIYFPLSRYNTIFHLLCHLLKVLFDFIYTYLMTCVACELNHPCDAFVIFSCGSSEMLNLACVGRLEQVYCTYVYNVHADLCMSLLGNDNIFMPVATAYYNSNFVCYPPPPKSNNYLCWHTSVITQLKVGLHSIRYLGNPLPKVARFDVGYLSLC